MIRTVVFVAFLAFAAATKSYEGSQVWRLSVSHEQKMPFRQIVQEHNLDIWGQGKDWIDVMVLPELRSTVMFKLASASIHSQVMIENVQTLIENDEQSIAKNNRAGAVSFDQYNTFEDIEAYLSEIAASDDRTNLVSLGESVEGRNLWQLEITIGDDKPDIWIDCGIHAREWITPATCLWGINNILENYGVDSSVTELMDTYDLYILTVNNPDGYAYTMSDERLWRKNRNHYAGNTCTGVDLNRNFDDHFAGVGTSDSPCSDTYHGPSAASEPETAATQGGIDALVPTAKALFSIHSYSQLWMYPYGYTYDLPPESDEMDAVSATGVAALTAVYGTEYEYGPVASTIYPAASTTIDYSYAAGITHSYTLELRDTGTFGFLLPAAQIEPTAEETWAGLIAGIMAIP